MKRLFLINSLLALIFTAACGNTANTGSADNADVDNSGTSTGVYLAGFDSLETTAHALYKHDDSPTQLSPDVNAIATGIFVTDSNIYVSGNYIDSLNDDRPCYWTGTTKTNLDVAGSDEGSTTGIYVSGIDVYVSGYYNIGATKYACYWKNGVLVDLGAKFHELQTVKS